MEPRVEICVTTVASVLAAEAGGADRVELCHDMPAGGTTPSIGAVDTACRLAKLPVHILIRPRPGDFCYTELELDVMRRDIAAARAAGAAGAVLGALRADGSVDRAAMASFIEVARPMSLTFHRAFDSIADPFAAFEDLIAMRVDRLLTSGGAPTAVQGLPRLEALVAAARGRIAVMAGGAITLRDIPPLLASRQISELHFGSAACRIAGATDPHNVRGLVAAIRDAWGHD
jgi:copper homeostasis protein